MLLVARTAAALPRTVAALARSGTLPQAVMPFALLENTPLPVELPPAARGIIITSAAAVQATPAPCPLPAYCVGEATAQAARAKGLQVAYAGTADGAALARHLVATLPAQTLVHLAGPRGQSPWYAVLREAGFKVAVRKAYSSVYVKKLPQPVRTALNNGKITCLMVFSPRAGQVLARLFAAAGMPRVPVVAISKAAAAAFDGWPRVTWAARPNLEEMIRVLEQQAQP